MNSFSDLNDLFQANGIDMVTVSLFFHFWIYLVTVSMKWQVLQLFIATLGFNITEFDYLKYKKNQIVLYKDRQSYDERNNTIDETPQKVKILKTSRHLTLGNISGEYH